MMPPDVKWSLLVTRRLAGRTDRISSDAEFRRLDVITEKTGTMRKRRILGLSGRDLNVRD